MSGGGGDFLVLVVVFNGVKFGDGGRDGMELFWKWGGGGVRWGRGYFWGRRVGWGWGSGVDKERWWWWCGDDVLDEEDQEGERGCFFF
ncbi:hypothetical protein LIER_42745 [Lithospermum erythrorhizon]|uniref:Uncharacterized protein n=1 Tax=Lithospermum erythrorhizon TaxID=34254 RepID=A0AAV3NU82_LITER